MAFARSFAMALSLSIINWFIPRPPKRVGNERSCLSTSEQLYPPVIAGMNSFHIIFSKESKLLDMSGSVRIK